VLLGRKGKLVAVISPLEALERDQVSPRSTYFKRKELIRGLQVIQAQENGIDAIIDEDTTHMADIWE